MSNQFKLEYVLRNNGSKFEKKHRTYPLMPGVGLMVRVVGLGSSSPELKSRSAVELIPGGVNSACHPSEVGKISASMLVYCVGVATRPGLFLIAKETAEAAPTLCTEYDPNLLLYSISTCFWTVLDLLRPFRTPSTLQTP